MVLLNPITQQNLGLVLENRHELQDFWANTSMSFLHSSVIDFGVQFLFVSFWKMSTENNYADRQGDHE